ncbi:response regulator transcription factor [Clostridium sporogenes]|uniref:response regulator transcription factor n=1 Tax=Clostridium sporogenes TaxID=1509 RepID=UPI002902BB40|nr:response regulator transcription factor [Clostridium botulinum]
MNKNINVLVVEDDNDINSMLAKLMKKSHYNVIQAYSGTEAMLHIKNTEIDLVLLDLALPGITGEELLQNIRKTREMPVIVISAKVDKKDKVHLLNLGADDYITKPFDIEELSARVYSNLRRYMKFNNNNESKQNLVYKDIIINKDTKEVFVNDKEVALTVKEFRMLELLLSHPKKIFSKANLFESVWGEEYLGDDNTVNVHMSNLRNKLQRANPEEEYIETIWGMGYKLKV